MNNFGSRGIWHPEVPHRPSRWPFFYGWTILAVGTLGIVCTIPGQTMGVSVFTDILIDRLGLSRMQLSIAYLVGTTMSGFLLPLGGRAFDRYGSRKTATLISFLLGLVLIYFSFSDIVVGSVRRILGSEHWIVAFGLILLGFFTLRFTAQGMLAMSSQAMIGKWFHERRGLIMSISGVFVSIAFSLTPLVFNYMIQAFGWRGAWQVMAALLIFGLTLICYLFFRDNPEECGLEMDGPLKGTGAKKSHPDNIVVRDFTRNQAIKTVGFWAFCGAFTWWALFGTGYTFHVVAISEEIEVAKTTLLTLFIPSAIAGTVANFVIGFVSDYIRIKYVLMAMCLGMFLVPLGLLVLPHKVGFGIMVLGMGITNGSFANLSGNIWPRFFGRTHLGAIHGFNASVTVIGSGLGPALFTVFKDYASGFNGMFWVGMCVPCAILVFSFYADNPQRKLLEQKAGK
ncbi:MAG: MFS transporter [Verrucomicrobiae bacterium]|nr:MFS transporter [Verrucomicrobiae bacterium]